jgi:hypothetical protein
MVGNICGKYWVDIDQPCPKNWTPELVKRVEAVDNRTSRAVDFWMDSILGGYITEFSIDCTQAYNVAERDFFKGPRGRFIRSLATSIKMLLCDKEVMTMELDC